MVLILVWVAVACYMVGRGLLPGVGLRIPRFAVLFYRLVALMLVFWMFGGFGCTMTFGLWGRWRVDII